MPVVSVKSYTSQCILGQRGSDAKNIWKISEARDTDGVTVV